MLVPLLFIKDNHNEGGHTRGVQPDRSKGLMCCVENRWPLCGAQWYTTMDATMKNNGSLPQDESNIYPVNDKLHKLLPLGNG